MRTDNLEGGAGERWAARMKPHNAPMCTTPARMRRSSEVLSLVQLLISCKVLSKTQEIIGRGDKKMQAGLNFHGAIHIASVRMGNIYRFGVKILK